MIVPAYSKQVAAKTADVAEVLSPEGLRRVMDSMLDGVAVVRSVRRAGEIVDFEWVYVNRAGAETYQRPQAELVGHRLGQTLPGFYSSGRFDEYAHLVETGEPRSATRRAYHDDFLSGVFTKRAWRHGDGFVVTWRDVSAEEATRSALVVSEERFRATVEQLPDSVSVFTAIRDDHQRITDFTWVFANAATCTLTGFRAEELIGRGLLKVLPEHGPSGMFDIYCRLVETGEPYAQPTVWYEDDWGNGIRQRRAFDVRASKVNDGFVVVTADVTQLREQTEALKERGSELARTNAEVLGLNELGNLLQACPSLDETYRIITSSCAALFPGFAGTLSTFDLPTGMLITAARWPDRLAGHAFGPDDCWALRLGRLHLSREGGPRCGHDDTGAGPNLCVPLVGRGETLGVLRLEVAAGGESPDGVPAPVIQLAVSVAAQISMAVSNLQLRERLRDLSVRDQLTGLFNRRYLDESMARELARATSAGEQIAVLHIDIDHFKKINDGYGHPAGDAVITAVASVLAAGVRTSDIACRYGGEEFTLMLTNASPEVAAERAEALRQAVEAMHVHHDGVELPPVTISCGTAAGNAADNSASGILLAADKALYAAKHAGRNTVISAELPRNNHRHEGLRSLWES